MTIGPDQFILTTQQHSLLDLLLALYHLFFARPSLIEVSCTIDPSNSISTSASLFLQLYLDPPDNSPLRLLKQTSCLNFFRATNSLHDSYLRTSVPSRARNTRIRRPSVRHQQQAPEEDRFLNLRRSARIAQHQQEQQSQNQAEEQHQASAMADVARRTYARNDHGPRGVDSRRSSRNDYPSPSSTRSGRTEISSNYSLTVVNAPPSNLSSGGIFNATILVSSRSSSRRSSNTSATGLLAVASLVAETSSGARPLPAGYLLTAAPGAKLMDSVQEPTRHELAYMPREHRADVVGAVSFADLCVREPGTYRVRITLAKMRGDVYEAVAEVDSPAFRVSGRAAVPNGVKY